MKIIKLISKINIPDIWIIIFLVILNIVLKSIYLIDYNIDLDEPYTLFHSQQSLKEFFPIFKRENNPPLYFVILHFWIKLFGVGILAARILPMLFSSFAVIYIFKTGKKFLNLKIGLGVSFLYTFSNIIIGEAHDCRVYSLLVLLTVMSMYFFLSIIKNKRNKFYLVALAIVNVLLIYSHFLAFFVILGQFLFIFFLKPVRKRILKKYIITLLIMLVAYLPYGYILFIRFSKTMQTGIEQHSLEFLYPYVTSLNTFGNGFISGNIFLLIILVFCGVILLGRIKLTVYEKILSGWFILLYLILVLVSSKLQVLSTPRYIIFLVPGFFFLLMIAADHLFKEDKVLNYFIPIAIVILMVSSTNLNFSNRMEAKNTASYIKDHKSDSTQVYIVPHWIGYVFTYHYNIEIFTDYINYTKNLNDDNIFLISSVNDIDTIKLKTATDVLLLDGWNNMSDVDPDYQIMKILNRQFNEPDQTIRNHGYNIYHYSRWNKINNVANTY
jgi:uncharacterized membrane protein